MPVSSTVDCRRAGRGVQRLQPAGTIDAQQYQVVVLVLGDAVGIAESGDRDRQAAVGKLPVGDDRAVVADHDPGAVFDGLARRRTRDLGAGREWIERARHRDHGRLDGIFGRLIVQDGEDADLIAPERSAQVEFLQALQTRQHEEIRFDHGVVDRASGRFFLLPLGEFGGGGTGLLAPRQHNLDGPARRTPSGAVGVAGFLRYQLGRDAQPHPGAGVGDDLPADIVPAPFRGLGQRAALLRIKHAGRLAAALLLKFLDCGQHALADLARDRAVILADPGEVRLQRLTLSQRHRVGGVGRGLQRGPDRGCRHRLGLGARRGRRRHLPMGGFRGECPQDHKYRGHEHQCCCQHRSHDTPGAIDARAIKHICLVGDSRG